MYTREFWGVDLIIFDGQIVASFLEMGYLHEIASQHGLPDVDVIVSAVEVGAAHLQVEPRHDSHQLLANIVR